MMEEKKFVAPAEIEDDDLEQVAGGATDANGNWICKYCGQGIPGVKTNADCMNHYKTCTYSPLRK